MKSIKNFIYILFFSVIVFGCNDEEFLNEAPVSSVSTKSYFENSNQFEVSVTAAYTNLHAPWWLFSEMRSDNSTFQYNNTDKSGNIFWDVDRFTMGADNGLNDIIWDNAYQGIGKCNSSISHIKEADAENKSRYIAEAKFLRAFYYFHLVRYFGEVPLVTEPITSAAEAFEENKRTATSKIFEQIVSDLNEAKQNLPGSYLEDKGRATEGAARTLLADVYMWQGQYGDAISELEEVQGQYSLLNDYSSVFDINNENNEEIIFSIQYMTGPHGLGNAFMYTFLPWNSEDEYISHGQVTAGTGMHVPTEDLIETFEEGDERLNMIDTSYTTQNNLATYHDSIVPFTKKFLHEGHAVKEVCGSNFPIYRYPHVLLMLAECYEREGGGDPLTLVNQVRDRAGLSSLSSVTLDDIIHERRLEFHCEADRWDVLVRTERAKEVMKAHGEEEQNNRVNIRENSYDPIKILYPIPSDVITTDPTIEQNPEYTN